MKNRQEGFSAVEVSIVLVVVGLLGFGGWYIWQSKNSKATNSTVNTVQETPAPTSSDDQETTSDKDLVTTRTKYIDTYVVSKLDSSKNQVDDQSTKKVYSSLHEQGYISDSFFAKLNTYANDYDGLQCVATGIASKATYERPSLVASSSNATILKVETYDNPNGGTTTQNVTFKWAKADDTWKLNGVDCQY